MIEKSFLHWQHYIPGCHLSLCPDRAADFSIYSLVFKQDPRQGEVSDCQVMAPRKIVTANQQEVRQQTRKVMTMKPIIPHEMVAIKGGDRE